jgi:hypothetical protein
MNLLQDVKRFIFFCFSGIKRNSCDIFFPQAGVEKQLIFRLFYFNQKKNSNWYIKSLIPLSFASLPTKSLSGQAPERGKEKGFYDPKEISPVANHGCRQR